MQTASSETESNSLDLSICVHHYTLRTPCPKGQGNDCTVLKRAQAQRTASARVRKLDQRNLFVSKKRKEATMQKIPCRSATVPCKPSASPTPQVALVKGGYGVFRITVPRERSWTSLTKKTRHSTEEPSICRGDVRASSCSQSALCWSIPFLQRDQCSCSPLWYPNSYLPRVL